MEPSSSSLQTEVLYPSEEEIKSYFPNDIWDAMADYERKSYRNILHNYNVMKSLDLKPKKPSFMTLHPKKATRRKNISDLGQKPPKKIQLSVNKPMKTSKETPKKKNTVMFDSDYKWRCVKQDCVFNAVFKVYKRYHGMIKGYYLSKKKSLKVAKKHKTSKVKKGKGKPTEIKVIEKVSEDQRKQKEILKKQNEPIPEALANSFVEKPSDVDMKNMATKEVELSKIAESSNNVTGDDGPKSEVESNCLENIKKEKLMKRIKQLVDPKVKPPCRSIQTMTVADGESPSNTPLVFVNAATSIKLSAPLPDPKPLSAMNQKLMKLINKVKMKYRRNVQTQTAAENSSIEEAELVFYPTPELEKDNSTAKTEPESDNKASLAIKETPQEIIPAAKTGNETKPDKPLEGKPDTGNKKTPVSSDNSGKVGDSNDSSDDEFGFYALAKQEKEAAAAKALSRPEPAELDQPEPGPSGLPSKRRYPRRAVPVINYTESELLQDDEYLFCDLCDREYEGDCPEHGPHKYFPDRSAPVTGDSNRAVQTTPAMLKVDKSKIPGAGSGVWTMLGLPPHVRFGPYQGDKAAEPDPLGYSWAIVKDKRVDHYIAAQSTATSNWMRFVNCARHESEQNLMAFQYKGEMYYRTVKLIPPKSELFVWYGKEYAEMLGISMESFRSKDTSHLRSLVFPCGKCNVTYTSPLYLEMHEKRCRGGREKGVVKVDPSAVPTDVQTLAVVVDGKKTFCCNLCEYKTGNSRNMKRHMIAHSGQRPHVCDVCGKGFTEVGSLERHKRIHSGKKQFKCDQCSYESNRIENLNRHMARRHTGEKVYACAQCDYKTAASSDMEKHTRTHTGDRPYSCTLCPYRAAESSTLTQHMRTHTGEKPFACSLCSYRAARSSNLTTHMRTHTGEKPYSCPHCDYRTAWLGELKRHIAGTHTTLQ